MVDYEVKTVSTYNPWITFKKFLYGSVFVLIPAWIAYAIQFIQEPGNIPIEYTVYIPFIVGLLTGFVNWVKHRKDTEEIHIDKATGLIINND